jgi:hypothetical protein
MWLAIAAAGAGLLIPASAQALDYTPVDQPGPPLGVSQSKLDASLECKGNPASTSGEPVLLVPGTTVNPRRRIRRQRHSDHVCARGAEDRRHRT